MNIEKTTAVILALVALKSIIIGSDFNFPLWFKHGKKYMQWYFNRPKFPN